MKTRIMLTLSLIAFLAVTSGYGQQSIVIAKIDFPFTVEGKALPAGDYEFVRDTSALVFSVKSGGKEMALAPILTRISAEIHTTLQDAHVVFDKVGDTYSLAEIWIPGQDGYMLLVTKAKHEHKVVNVKY